MIWKHLREDLSRLARHVSDYHETNVTAVSLDTDGALIFEADMGLQDDIDDLKHDLKTVESNLKLADTNREEAEKRAEEAEEQLEQLRAELANLRDPESGVSVADYRARTEKAEEQVDEWREYCRAADKRVADMERELAAMRKRKGVEPGLMAHSWEVSGFINKVINIGRCCGLGWEHNYQRQVEILQCIARELREKIDGTAGKKAVKEPLAA